MTHTEALRRHGQSLWLDNITRTLLDQGTLSHYIEALGITGLTSNPTIFDHAITGSDAYDADIARLTRAGRDVEAVFFELAIADLRRAAGLFEPIHRRTATVDGWVSLEVSPLLAEDAEGTIAQASALHRRAQRPNLFIKIPGTSAGERAIEECTFAGVPVNVTLLFSREQYLRAAAAYQRGLERRLEAGLCPDVRSVASLFISRWDKASADRLPEGLRNRLGIAIGQQVYGAYRDVLDSPAWQRLENYGARAQRLLFASTGTKDPNASDTLYVDALIAPNTVDTVPEQTLRAFAEHGHAGSALSRDTTQAEALLRAVSAEGVDLTALASQLQEEGARAFADSWRDLMGAVERKAKSLAEA